MLKILVAGSIDANDPRRKDIEEFCSALGKDIITQGHMLLNGCSSGLDVITAKAAYMTLKAINAPDPDKRVISYVLSNREPAHDFGTLIRSKLADWEIDKVALYVPEQIHLADVVILVGGSDGTLRAANWARIDNKPLLPVAVFGRASAKVFEQELNDFAHKYAGRIEQIEYQELHSVKRDWQKLAMRIVSLAEKIATSKSVIALMSYSKRSDLDDVYDSFQAVCCEFSYQCERVGDSNTVKRIVPTILKQIEASAFVIADLTELKTNVLFELGYAEGFKKPVIVTAKLGTELPFDVKDVPAIFWKGQKKLKEDLRTKIKIIAQAQGR